VHSLSSCRRSLRLEPAPSHQTKRNTKRPRRSLRERDLNVLKRQAPRLAHTRREYNKRQKRDRAEEEVRAVRGPREEDRGCERDEPICKLLMKEISKERATTMPSKAVKT